MNKTKVIAISGVSGCGKTTLVKQLSKVFDCPSLCFDDHTDENTYPNDMKAWFEAGAVASEIKTPLFVSALERLIKDSTIAFIFIEEPFGRCRDSIAPLVDHVVLLDMPMEVCLSRVMMRNINNEKIDSLTAIPRYLSMYDEYFRELYIESTAQVRENCDLVITQVNTIDATSHAVRAWLTSVCAK